MVDELDGDGRDRFGIYFQCESFGRVYLIGDL